jgi:hypothetical protein
MPTHGCVYGVIISGIPGAHAFAYPQRNPIDGSGRRARQRAAEEDAIIVRADKLLADSEKMLSSLEPVFEGERHPSE